MASKGSQLNLIEIESSGSR